MEPCWHGLTALSFSTWDAMRGAGGGGLVGVSGWRGGGGLICEAASDKVTVYCKICSQVPL